MDTKNKQSEVNALVEKLKSMQADVERRRYLIRHYLHRYAMYCNAARPVMEHLRETYLNYPPEAKEKCTFLDYRDRGLFVVKIYRPDVVVHFQHLLKEDRVSVVVETYDEPGVCKNCEGNYTKVASYFNSLLYVTSTLDLSIEETMDEILHRVMK